MQAQAAKVMQLARKKLQLSRRLGFGEGGALQPAGYFAAGVAFVAEFGMLDFAERSGACRFQRRNSACSFRAEFGTGVYC